MPEEPKELTDDQVKKIEDHLRKVGFEGCPLCTNPMHVAEPVAANTLRPDGKVSRSQALTFILLTCPNCGYAAHLMPSTVGIDLEE